MWIGCVYICGPVVSIHAFLAVDSDCIVRAIQTNAAAYVIAVFIQRLATNSNFFVIIALVTVSVAIALYKREHALYDSNFECESINYFTSDNDFIYAVDASCMRHKTHYILIQQTN